MRLDFRWNHREEDILNRVTGGERGKLFLANEAKRLMDPYVPALNMGLARNVKVSIENGQGSVHYQSPYARYQYHGKVMVSKRPGVRGAAKIVKQPEQDLTYTKFRHPLATSKWDKAMLSAHKDDLVRAMQNYVEGGR